MNNGVINKMEDSGKMILMKKKIKIITKLLNKTKLNK